MRLNNIPPDPLEKDNLEQITAMAQTRGLKIFRAVPSPKDLVEGELVIVVSGGSTMLYTKVANTLYKLTFTT